VNTKIFKFSDTDNKTKQAAPLSCLNHIRRVDFACVNVPKQGEMIGSLYFTVSFQYKLTNLQNAKEQP
jgi:hypothetical protein